MDESAPAIVADAPSLQGLGKVAQLLGADTRNYYIGSHAFHVIALTSNAARTPAKLVVVIRAAISGDDLNFLGLEVILNVVDELDEFQGDREFLLSTLAPEDMIDRRQGILVVATALIAIDDIEIFIGHHVVHAKDAVAGIAEDGHALDIRPCGGGRPEKNRQENAQQ